MRVSPRTMNETCRTGSPARCSRVCAGTRRGRKTACAFASSVSGSAPHRRKLSSSAAYASSAAMRPAYRSTLGLGSGRLVAEHLERTDLVRRVEGGHLVRLGERRVVEHGVDEVVDGTAAAHDRLPDVHEVRGAGAEDVHAQKG